MKCYIVDSFLGFIAYDENLKIVAARNFKDKDEAISQLLELERTGICPLLEDLVKELLNLGYDTIILENEKESMSLKSKFNIQFSTISPSAAGRAFRIDPINEWQKIGLEDSFTEMMQKEVAESFTKVKIRLAFEKRDKLVAQAVTALDEIEKITNIVVSRVREWYGLHFPELGDFIDDHRLYLRVVSEFGERNNYEFEKLEEVVRNEGKSKAIIDLLDKSIGAEVREKDMEKIKELARICLSLYSYRESLEKYIDEVMKEVAPNIREIVGSILGARLIALSGGLESLAKKPASTIQVLGAEKALFRALKTGTRPPKHGIIFQSPYVHSAPKWQRGKIARALAGKLSIAARVDAFGGTFISSKIKRELEERIAEIKKKYARPSKKLKRKK
ncbi:MAG: C/D box methylation guide ribonucleoprotein complex aNOP56 subunit [Nitrososphaerota archaeon]|nr:C/D box methylation guide ribonucleoprotein complex aNOP56 subunit [Nitrososphaerota archaeon]